MNSIKSPHMKALIELALSEDIGSGDITCRLLISEEAKGVGVVVAREELVVSGIDLAGGVFRSLDKTLEVRAKARDGDLLSKGSVILELEGSLSSILSGERTALNFLQRLSGVATLTRRYVSLLEGSKARLLDTRKTTPGWRLLEKEAVRHGGAFNHRVGLFDGVLIKDNHLLAVGDLRKAVRLAKNSAPTLLKVQVEVENLDDLEDAIEAGADLVLLDNMDNETIERAVALAQGRVPLEASGGITLERLPSLAATGVDFISCGAITHSATAVDLALDLQPK